MGLKTEALTGGFAVPVFHAQSVFKMLMDGMARPGTIQTVQPDVAPPAPLGIAAGTIALTLCDHDTPVWLSQGLARSAVPEWLGFHTGAPLTTERPRRALPSPRPAPRFPPSASLHQARRNIPIARRPSSLSSPNSRVAAGWR